MGVCIPSSSLDDIMTSLVWEPLAQSHREEMLEKEDQGWMPQIWDLAIYVISYFPPQQASFPDLTSCCNPHHTGLPMQFVGAELVFKIPLLSP